MSQNAIEIAGLQKTYAASGKSEAKEALKGIDLNIPRGSVFGLLGPNGAGKSTLINILAGLVLKCAGSVKIWGFDQDANPRQSVPKSQRKTDEILDFIGLTDKADAYARSLSGGMRRRLLMGKALVHTPHILVLDEPTAGVDIALRNMLWANVRKLNDQGTTIILTTHYLEEAQEMCDEIAIINHGSLIVRDTTENLLSRLDSKTMVVRPASTATLPPLPADITGTAREDGTLAFSYHTNATSADQILDILRTANIQIADISTEQSDLEDVFLALTENRADDSV